MHCSSCYSRSCQAKTQKKRTRRRRSSGVHSPAAAPRHIPVRDGSRGEAAAVTKHSKEAASLTKGGPKRGGHRSWQLCFPRARVYPLEMRDVVEARQQRSNSIDCFSARRLRAAGKTGLDWIGTFSCPSYTRMDLPRTSFEGVSLYDSSRPFLLPLCCHRRDN